jgi:type IV pilus assembly protein PilX
MIKSNKSFLLLPHRQRGVSLLIALVFLLILTLLGLSSSNVAVMQERMAGNVTQSNEAFQLAESTLKAVESDVFDGICVGGGSGGFGAIPRLEDLGLEENDCTMSGFAVPTNTWALAPAEVAQPGGGGWARFMIARVPSRPRCSDLNSEVFGGNQVSDESYVILASARSASGISEAVVQSIYTCLL